LSGEPRWIRTIDPLIIEAVELAYKCGDAKAVADGMEIKMLVHGFIQEPVDPPRWAKH
jgi:hypothetical protein